MVSLLGPDQAKHIDTMVRTRCDANGWMRAAALAQGAGIEMSSRLFAEVSAQLLPVTPTGHWLEYVDWADPVLLEPLHIEKGLALPSLRPGLGMAWERKGGEEVPGVRGGAVCDLGLEGPRRK